MKTNRTINRFFTLVLSLGLMLSLLAGCGQTGPAAGTTTAGATTTAGTTAAGGTTTDAAKGYKIGLTQFANHPSLDNCRLGFIEGLRQAGFIEGQNVTFDYQNAQGDTGTANLIAQSYVAGGYDLICGIATPSAQACYNAAQPKGIPVIFSAVSDPVAAQLAVSGNQAAKGVTGTSDALPLEKQLKLIRAFLPDAKKLGILYNTSEVNSASQIKALETLAPQYGFELITVGVSSAADIPMAADNILSKVDCLNNLTDNLVVQNLPTILDKANAKSIPIFGSEEEQVKNGCMACEGIDYYNLGIQTGQMAAAVLKGTAIEDIPFETIKDSQPFYNSKVLNQFGVELPAEYQDTATDLGKE
ncbi:MAG: ABC transporter substrate-binding protein [Clostridiaceae bacterium]|nr:ABC transporter substrate-binding protein [Clostridiaceae bacterium]